MKKTICLFLLLLLTSVSPVFAQGAETPTPLPFAAPSRYLSILTRDIVTYSLDTETLRYVKDPYRDELLVEAWIKSNEVDAVNARYQRYYFRQKEHFPEKRELLL